MESVLIYKGRTKRFNPIYLADIGLDVETIKGERHFQIETGRNKGVYRFVGTDSNEHLKCRLLEPKD